MAQYPQRWKGIAYQVSGQLILTLVDLTSKLLYQKNPAMTQWHMIFSRYIIIVALTIIALNKSFPSLAMDFYFKGKSQILFWRTLCTMLNIFIFFWCIKVMPLAEYAMVYNLLPLLIVLFSACFLGEKILPLFFGAMMVCTFGLTALMLGKIQSEDGA